MGRKQKANCLHKSSWIYAPLFKARPHAQQTDNTKSVVFLKVLYSECYVRASFPPLHIHYGFQFCVFMQFLCMQISCLCLYVFLEFFLWLFSNSIIYLVLFWFVFILTYFTLLLLLLLLSSLPNFILVRERKNRYGFG